MQFMKPTTMLITSRYEIEDVLETLIQNKRKYDYRSFHKMQTYQVESVDNDVKNMTQALQLLKAKV